MKKKFLAALIFVGASVTINAQTSNISPTPTPEPSEVCLVGDIPEGFVIVGYNPTATCKGLSLIVKRVAEGDVVCASSPVPDGFSIITRTNSPACNAGNARDFNNALVLGLGRPLVMTEQEVVARQKKTEDERDRVNGNMKILDKALKECANFDEAGRPRRVPVRCKVSTEDYMNLVALPRIENAEKIEIIASERRHEEKARPEQPSRKNEHWADANCESLFKMADDAGLVLIGNEDNARRMYSKMEWDVLAKCLVKLRKEGAKH